MEGQPYDLKRLSISAAELDQAAFAERYPDPVFWIQACEGEGSKFFTSDGSDVFELKTTVAPVAKRDGANDFGLMVTIGRAATNDIVLGVADVSKFHAYVMLRRASGVQLADAGSSMGTRVDGHPLEARKPYLLKPGSLVEMGSAQLTFLDSAGLYRQLHDHGGDEDSDATW
jgi:hypothetical protein